MAIKDVNLPAYYTDPLFKSSQEYLAPYGKNILEGNIPDYYKAIGMAGSPEFLDLLNLTKRDIMTSVTEDAARRNISGPAVSLAIAKAVGDTSTKMRYEDYSRSLAGKEFLFSGGKDITEGVRNSALDYGNSMNTYNVNAANFAMSKEATLEQMEQAEKDRNAQMWLDILTSGIGAAGNIYGVGQLNSLLRGSAAERETKRLT